MSKAPISTNGDSSSTFGDDQDTFVDSVASRVRDLAEQHRHNATTLGQKVGVSKSSAALYWAGKRSWPTETLHLLADELHTTVDYILCRTDDPGILEFRGSPTDFENFVQHSRPGASGVSDRQLEDRAQERSLPDIVEIDQVDLRYGMGGSFNDHHVEVEKRQFSREWLRSITRTAPSKLAWATGDGDSMEPTIRSGEIVLIDTSADARRFDDTIWAITMGELGMIKRLRSRGEGVELLSDNPLVPPQMAVDGEMHAVGRVIAVVRRL